MEFMAAILTYFARLAQRQTTAAIEPAGFGRGLLALARPILGIDLVYLFMRRVARIEIRDERA